MIAIDLFHTSDDSTIPAVGQHIRQPNWRAGSVLNPCENQLALGPSSSQISCGKPAAIKLRMPEIPFISKSLLMVLPDCQLLGSGCSLEVIQKIAMITLITKETNEHAQFHWFAYCVYLCTDIQLLCMQCLRMLYYIMIWYNILSYIMIYTLCIRML